MQLAFVQRFEMSIALRLPGRYLNPLSLKLLSISEQK
jgi:hypothetical protein